MKTCLGKNTPQAISGKCPDYFCKNGVVVNIIKIIFQDGRKPQELPNVDMDVSHAVSVGS